MIAQPFPLANPYGNDSSSTRKVDLPKQDLAVRLICPECRDQQPNIEEEFSSGDLVCRGCGLVLGDRIVDTRSECVLCYFLFYFCEFP
jgi:transcription initiation factor TFIIB